MSTIEIRQVQREGARLVIGLSGQSGTGKTFTAIQLAYGLAKGDGSKVGFLDTENRRGSLYANIVKEPFLIADLFPPFSPQRYIDAILAFQKAGVEVLIIDSGTHEWEGTGGCNDIAAAATNKVIGWSKAKEEHKRFMNVLLQSNMHIIVCLRAREKIDMEDPKRPVKLGVQPVCEKNFMFEMTASLMFWDEGRRQTVLKCPEDLRPMLGRGTGFITSQDGEKIRAWVDGATQLDPEVEAARNGLQTVTERGLEALKAAWGETPARIQRALGTAFLDTLKASAKAYENVAAGGASDPAVDRFSTGGDV